MLSYLYDYKYHILVTVLLIVMGYIIRNYKGNEIEKVKTVEINNHKGKDIELEKLIKSFENAIKKSTNTIIKFNSNNALKNNYLNMRNELFTKDIVKRKILIDSSLRTGGNNNNDYYVSLNKTSDIYKNIIGIRLIECSIPITSHNINNNNNSVKLIKGGLPHTITFSNGEYTFTEIADEIKSKILPIDSSFNIVADIDGEDANTYTITRAADLFFKFKETNNSFYKLLGYDKIDESTVQTQPHGDVHHGYNYLDIILDNIPPIACKMNTNGDNILDRIFINVASGTIQTYRVPESETQTSNYFYPISLNELSIKIKTSDGEIYHSKAGQNFFEFEITTLVNTKLMN